MPLKVAVLEEDPAPLNDTLIPELISLGFDAEGFCVAKDLYRRMLAKTFDAVVLDIAVVDENGFEVARYLQVHSRLAIIALAGTHPTDADKSALTADAWLTKPVDIELLAAVVSDLRKRKQADEPADAAARRWKFDPLDWKLHAPNGRSLRLGLSERLIVEHLLAQPGKVVPREDLIGTIAESTYDFDPHRLEMLIHRLRRKVKEMLHLPLPLHTVRGKGYTMLLEADEPAAP